MTLRQLGRGSARSAARSGARQSSPAASSQAEVGSEGRRVGPSRVRRGVAGGEARQVALEGLLAVHAGRAARAPRGPRPSRAAGRPPGVPARPRRAAGRAAEGGRVRRRRRRCGDPARATLPPSGTVAPQPRQRAVSASARTSGATVRRRGPGRAARATSCSGTSGSASSPRRRSPSRRARRATRWPSRQVGQATSKGELVGRRRTVLLDVASSPGSDCSRRTGPNRPRLATSSPPSVAPHVGQASPTPGSAGDLRLLAGQRPRFLVLREERAGEEPAVAARAGSPSGGPASRPRPVASVVKSARRSSRRFSSTRARSGP